MKNNKHVNNLKDVKRLYRSKNERMLAGICGGFGEYANVDPTLIRLIFILITIFTGFAPGIIAYIILWIVVPENPYH